MGSRRKSALKRLEGLQRQIEKHLRKIIDNQDSRDTEHWREEVRSWLSQMDRLLRHLGRRNVRTGREPVGTIRRLRSRLSKAGGEVHRQVVKGLIGPVHADGWMPGGV